MEEKGQPTNDGIDQSQNPPNLMQQEETLTVAFMNTHELNQEQYNKIKDKFKKDKDFV